MFIFPKTAQSTA